MRVDYKSCCQKSAGQKQEQQRNIVMPISTKSSLCIAVAMALCCCTVLVQSTCNGISAPEATLPELHSSCNSHAVTRSSGCYAAYHRYCNSRTTYPTSRQSIGVSREHSNNRVGLSCIRAHWKGNVMIGELRVIHRGCNSVQRAQYRDVFQPFTGTAKTDSVRTFRESVKKFRE